MKVREVMSTALEVVHPDTPYKELVERMLDHDVSGLPVVDADGNLVGIVTEADLISKPAYGANHRGRRAIRFVVEALQGHDPVWVRRATGLTAGEVMSRPVFTVGPDDGVGHAARTMLAHHVKRLPVTSEGRLVGLVARPDLMRSFARADRDIAAAVEAKLQDALAIPEHHQVRASVDEGVVTLTGTVRFPSDADVIAGVIGRIAGVVEVHADLVAREPEPRLENLHIPLVP